MDDLQLEILQKQKIELEPNRGVKDQNEGRELPQMQESVRNLHSIQLCSLSHICTCAHIAVFSLQVFHCIILGGGGVAWKI